MIKVKAPIVGVLLAGLGFLVEAPVVQADPLIPLSPSETAYLEYVHRFLPPSAPQAFNNDGWFLDQGWVVCRDRNIPLYGYNATFVSPIMAQAAFAYLCPK